MQTFYTVRPGESVSAIAKRWEIPVAVLIAANNLPSPYFIYPGQQLSVPSGVTTVQVKPGDSVYSLAQAYGVPMAAIIEANRLSPPYTIYIDQMLIIPPGVPYYVVQPGDTLYELAGRYNVTTGGVRRPDLIRQANGLPSDLIRVGMRLIIPYAPPGGAGRLAFVANAGGAYDLWLYDPRSGRTTAVGHQQADVHSVPYWSPDNRRIAFIGKQGVLFVLEVLQGILMQIDQLEPYTTLSWSPDSAQIAYTKQGRIVLYELATFFGRTLPVAGAKHVQWFPSGDKLLYAAPDNTGTDQLYEIRVDATGQRQITYDTNSPKNDVKLSPNGSYALFTSPGASISIIYVTDVNTGNISELTGGPLAKNYYPAWALGSAAIAYSATDFAEGRGYFSAIRTESPQGGGQQILSVSDCFATPVTWSPDSEAIAYLSGCRGTGLSSEIWIVDIRHPAPIRVVSGIGAITSVQWSYAAVPADNYTQFRSAEYRVSFPYPAAWRAVSETRHEGADGFFQVSALASDLPFAELCRSEAYHPLMPYGSSPRIVPARVQNQEACYIFPSSDQAPELRRQSAFIAVYPQPVVINGSTYPYFILWADQDHLQAMVNGLRFL
ncbi:LysM peptidoglycan-binding domain-containing protein [Paenibacillus rhizophilus]|uniref:LysM peptidoglycan-binding domain-containing protein n=1 Tax=Paenibacillus rhizophilus TaxID=1850366 RepID=UPI001FECEB60|nr:LysM peptidoglycan-binding domain-containing protein [Paenibacillus rhizophilus]